MHNHNAPQNHELPTARQLVRSTLLALVVALVLLVTVVLPSEYAIDPTGVGRLLGLTEMGEIKQQLAEEAAADAQAMVKPSLSAAGSLSTVAMAVVKPVAPQPIAAAVIAPGPQPLQLAQAKTVSQPVAATPEAIATTEAAAGIKKDQISFTLTPGQGAEVKLEMKQGAMVGYRWSANGGKLNYDTHGDPYNPPKGFYHGYGKGRFQPGDSGILEAAFDGNHGWFWRNRTKDNVTLTLTVEGEFIKMKRVI
ncbi:MAG: transmembrane anchor protein [Marinobacterium sp.]|nr:transmembrane anchor protein [Marinobacterium sp.]